MKQWDYRKILMAYIEYVGREEGTDFLGFAAVDGLRELGLDGDEIAELEHIAALTINPKLANGASNETA